MPRIRRWFHCSQELNHDPEFRVYAKKFGLAGVRFWIEVLAILDRTDNFWDLHKGFDLGLLAGTCETKKHIIQKSYEYLMEQRWLRVGIDNNQKLFIYAPKWMKYNQKREDKGTVMDTTKEHEGTHPTPSPTPPPTPSPEKEIHKEKGSNLNCSEDDLKAFEEFWEHYPERNGKRLDKQETQELFMTLPHEEQTLAIRAAKNYAISEMVQRGIGIKDPKRFLQNGKGSQPWKDWTDPEKPKTPVKDSSGRKSTTRPPPVYCKIHGNKDEPCMKRSWPKTERERAELIQSGWLCEQHKEVFVGQANEDNISPNTMEETS